jgi:hypothetical protein
VSTNWQVAQSHRRGLPWTWGRGLPQASLPDAHLKRQMAEYLSLLKERSRDRIPIGSAMSVPRGVLTGPSFLPFHSLFYSAAPAKMPRPHQ